MSHRQTPREQHQAHADTRNNHQALARTERRATEQATLRAVWALIQPHEPHHFTPPVCAPVSPRQRPDRLAAPGGLDHTGFCEGIC